MGPHHRRDSFGTGVCHSFHCDWMCLLLLSIVWKMWRQLRTRLPRKLGHPMLHFIHSPALLCGSPTVSLTFILTIFIIIILFPVTSLFVAYNKVYLCLSSIGTVFAFVSNEKLNSSIQNFNSTVNTAIDHSLDFVTDTQIVGSKFVSAISWCCCEQEANLTVERYDEVNAFVRCEINSELKSSYTV